MAFNPFLQMGLGWLPNSAANSNATQALSTGNQVAFGFVSPTTTTLETVRIYVTAVTSAPATTDFKCGILANGTTGAGPTGSALEEVSVSSGPTASAWADFTGFTQAVTRGVSYWIVFRNNGGAPSATVRVPNGQHQMYGTPPTFGYGYRRSSDTGATWAAATGFGRCTVRIGFADGTFIGFPLESERRADVASAGDRIQSAVEVGTLFSTPTNTQLKLRGLGFKLGKGGTPTGTVRFRLYRATTLVATTDAIALNQLDTGSDTRVYYQYFPTELTLDESTTYRAVIGATGSDSGGNYFGTDIYVWDADADSTDMKPFWGTAQKTVFTGSWAQTANEIVPCQLLLGDPPFTSTGGGGSGFKFISGSTLDSV